MNFLRSALEFISSSDPFAQLSDSHMSFKVQVRRLQPLYFLFPRHLPTQNTGNLQICEPVGQFGQGFSRRPKGVVMKTVLYRFYCGIAVVAMLVGCATPGRSGAQKSEALQIARAAGMKNIRDVSKEEYSDAVRARPELTGSTAVETIAVGTGIFSPTTGWNVSGQTTFLGVMTLLTALPTYVPENDHRFLVWMPLDEAETPEAAAIHMRDTIVSSFREALEGYDVALKKRYFGGSGAGERWYIAVDGPRCKGCEMW